MYFGKVWTHLWRSTVGDIRGFVGGCVHTLRSLTRDGKSMMEVICDVFQTYRYLIRESEIYFQQVLLYLGFENEYYFSLYDIFGNCLFFYI